MLFLNERKNRKRLAVMSQSETTKMSEIQRAAAITSQITAASIWDVQYCRGCDSCVSNFD